MASLIGEIPNEDLADLKTGNVKHWNVEGYEADPPLQRPRDSSGAIPTL